MNNKLLIPALIGSVLIPATSVPTLVRPALADTVSFTFLRSFGRDGSTYKVMVKSPRNGNRYFIWYYNSIGVNNGQEVLISINSSNYWTHISNPTNGKTSRIRKVEKVQ